MDELHAGSLKGREEEEEDNGLMSSALIHLLNCSQYMDRWCFRYKDSREKEELSYASEVFINERCF